jgi:hypothetical protein
MKQTTVEFIYQELWQAPKDKWMWQMILNQAKEMEKLEIESAYDSGMCEGFDIGHKKNYTSDMTGEIYYKERYK